MYLLVSYPKNCLFSLSLSPWWLGGVMRWKSFYAFTSMNLTQQHISRAHYTLQKESQLCMCIPNILKFYSIGWRPKECRVHFCWHIFHKCLFLSNSLTISRLPVLFDVFSCLLIYIYLLVSLFIYLIKYIYIYINDTKTHWNSLEKFVFFYTTHK